MTLITFYNFFVFESYLWCFFEMSSNENMLRITLIIVLLWYKVHLKILCLGVNCMCPVICIEVPTLKIDDVDFFPWCGNFLLMPTSTLHRREWRYTIATITGPGVVVTICRYGLDSWVKWWTTSPIYNEQKNSTL